MISSTSIVMRTIDQVFLSSCDAIRTIGDTMMPSSSILMRTIGQVFLSSGDAIRTIGGRYDVTQFHYKNNRTSHGDAMRTIGDDMTSSNSIVMQMRGVAYYAKWGQSGAHTTDKDLNSAFKS